MPRSRKCRICPEWHDMDEPWPSQCMGHYRLNNKRSDLPAPMLIRDEHWPEGRVSDADGKTYYYKSAYLKGVKAAGCDILMKGEKLRPPPPKAKPKLPDSMRREIRQSVQSLDSPTRKLDERRRRLNG